MINIIEKTESARKLSFCETCENVRFIEVPFVGRPMLQCKICNCIMNAKVKLAGSECPIKKF